MVSITREKYNQIFYDIAKIIDDSELFYQDAEVLKEAISDYLNDFEAEESGTEKLQKNLEEGVENV